MKCKSTIFFKRMHKYDLMIILFIIAIMIITGFIFSNSFQESSESNAKSEQISANIQSVVDPEREVAENDFHKFIRKSAHAIEFAILGSCFSCLMFSINAKYGHKYVGLSFFLMLCVAVTDEFIQEFNDRTSKVSDVMIDFAGAIVGFLLIVFAVLLTNYIKTKK